MVDEFVVELVKEDDFWRATLTYDDTETGEPAGVLDSDHEDKITACEKLARFCLTLGYRGGLLFFEEQGGLFLTANLRTGDVQIALYGDVAHRNPGITSYIDGSGVEHVVNNDELKG